MKPLSSPKGKDKPAPFSEKEEQTRFLLPREKVPEGRMRVGAVITIRFVGSLSHALIRR